MRALLIIVLTAFCAAPCLAQSRRVPSPGTGKPNARVSPTPTATPTPEDRDASIPEEREVIKVDTDVVTVPVRVLDKKGRFVAGLTRENFKIYEDNVEQPIAYFSSEQEPFTVALVLDMSYSAKFQINDIQSAAIAFIAQLGPRDKVMVVSFDQEVHMLCEPTSDRARIYRAIRSTKIATGTSLYEAVDLVMKARFNRITGRKAIILFTDGVDTTSTRSNDLENLRDALELDALIYPIRYDTFQDVQQMKGKPTIVDRPPLGGIPIPGRTPTGTNIPASIPTVVVADGSGTTVEEYRRAEEYLNQLALRTGGQVYLANSPGNLTGAFSKIASELREYYSLGFYPPDNVETGKQRRLRVRVDRPGVSIRARSSYVAGKTLKGKTNSK